MSRRASRTLDVPTELDLVADCRGSGRHRQLEPDALEVRELGAATELGRQWGEPLVDDNALAIEYAKRRLPAAPSAAK